MRHADLDVAKGDSISVVLKENVAVLPLPKPGDLLEFALGHISSKGLGTAIILDDLYAVEPVFHVHSLADDSCRVPFSNRVRSLARRCRDQVVDRTKRAVSIVPQLCVGVAEVVENLILEADCRSG